MGLGGGQPMDPVCVDFEAMSLGQRYNSGDAFYADTIGDPSIHEAASVLSFYVKDYVNATSAMISGGGVDVETGNIPHQGNELQISNAVLQIRPNAFHDTMAPLRHCLPFRLRIFLVSHWALTSMKPCRETRSGRKPLLWDGPLTTVAFLEWVFLNKMGSANGPVGVLPTRTGGFRQQRINVDQNSPKEQVLYHDCGWR